MKSKVSIIFLAVLFLVCSAFARELANQEATKENEVDQGVASEAAKKGTEGYGGGGGCGYKCHCCGCCYAKLQGSGGGCKCGCCRCCHHAAGAKLPFNNMETTNAQGKEETKN